MSASITTIRPGLLGMTTRDSGIVLMSDDRIVVLDDKKGLPTNSSWIMQVVDDYLYVSTIDGVWRTPIAALPDPMNGAPGAIPTEKVLGSQHGHAAHPLLQWRCTTRDAGRRQLALVSGHPWRGAHRNEIDQAAGGRADRRRSACSTAIAGADGTAYRDR